MHSSLLGILLLATTTAGQPGDAAPSAVEVRDAVQRSLPYLEKEGMAWITERKCLSCHVGAYMLWSHQEARAHGVKVDAKKFDEWTAWSLDYSLATRKWFKLADASVKQLQADGVDEPLLAKLKPLVNKPFFTAQEFLTSVSKVVPAEEADPHKSLLVKRAALSKSGENDGGSISTIGQLLVGLTGVKHPRMDPFLQALPGLLLKWQEANGSWKGTGQLPRQNRPQAEQDETTTGWVLLGLSSYGKTDPLTAKSFDAGLAYFKKSKPGKSNETLLVHMLVENKFGKPVDAAVLAKEVVRRQNADGGWGWLAGAPSDAFATGQSLYALSIAGTKTEAAAIGKAQKYLLGTQDKEGHWAVAPKTITDPKTPEARLKRLIPIYDYWGSAWASIGLSRSLALTK